MIFTESTIKISNNVSKMDSTIVLYRGDKNVEIRFTILQSPFKYSNTVATNVIESTNASYGQLVIKTPNDKPPIFSEVSATKEGTVLFTITKEMIDEIEEVGVYTFQIRLMDENKQSRVTIPPVENGIEIKEPIAIEDDNTTNVVGLAKANYAVTTLSDVDTPAFDDTGKYIKTNWNDGDVITNASLNKIEEGIYTTNENVTATKKYVDDNKIACTISSKVLGAVPASTLENFITPSDDRLLSPFTIANASINKDRRYFIEFLGSKKLCSLAISEKTGNSIACSIGNYNIQAFNSSTNIVINIEKINEDDTTATTFTDLVIYEEEVKYLDSKYLETDLVLQNSVSLGRVGNIGTGSSAVGDSTTASGENSHAEGTYTTASGTSSHAEGESTTASGMSSHTEGNSTTASGKYAHAEGNTTTASGDYGSHAEGSNTIASGVGSHAEGNCTTASGENSHAEGASTIASSQNQHVQGKYNIEDTNNKYAHIVGNGEDGKNSNAHTLDWEGNAWFAGKLTQEGTPTEGKDLTTKKYVDDNILLEQLPILRIDETNKRIYVNCNNMGTYKKYFVPNKYANVYGFSFIYTNEDSSETEIALIGGAMTRDDFILCARNTNTLFILILGGTNKYTYNKSTKTLEKSLYGYLKIGNTQEYAPTENYNPATKKYVDDKVTVKILPVDYNKNCATNVADLEPHSIYMSPNDADFLYLGYEKLDGSFSGLFLSGNPHGKFIYTGTKDDTKIEVMLEGICHTAYFKTDTVDPHTEKTVFYLTKNNTTEFTPSNDYEPATKKYVDDNKIACTISSKVLVTVPASNVKLDGEITVNNISINKDRRYYIEFLGSKKLCSLLISEIYGDCIACSIGNYFIEVHNNTFNISLYIEKLNADITTDAFTDLIIYEEEVKYIDNKYLETDLVLQNSISLGRVGDIGMGSSAIGEGVEASGDGSHAEGVGTTASGNGSHAEGDSTTASGYACHAEGSTTTASGVNSHAEGDYTTASGASSHAEGYGSKASSQFQHVQGKYNIEDKDRKYAHIVGNGAGDAKRSNAHTLDWQGNAWYSGKVTTGAAPVEDMDLTTKKYVDDKVTSLPQLSFNEDGELVVTINGVSKTFVPKNV